MVDYNRLSSGLLKTQKLWVEEGTTTVIKKVGYHIKKKISQHCIKSNDKKTESILGYSVNREALFAVSGGFFNSGLFVSLDKIKSDVKRISIKEADKIIKAANEILSNQLTIYDGVKIHTTGEKSSWSSDPLTGYMWPADSISPQIIWNKPNGTDIKNTWEPSRFQFFSELAYAYVMSGDDKYARSAMDKILAWIDGNPFPFGPNWTCPMEASIRLMNWCFYLPLLDIGKYASNTLQDKLSKSINEHFYYIRNNLEISPGHANNHYLSNITALLLARIMFPSVSWAIEYSEFAVKELVREIKRQFTDSGMNFEGSLPYHRLSSEICLIAAALIKKINPGLPEDIEKRLYKIAEFTRYYSTICDKVPLVGDNDSGIFVKFFIGQEQHKHRYLCFLFDIVLDGTGTPENDEEYLCSIHFKSTNQEPEIRLENKKKNMMKECNVRDFNGLVIVNYGNDGLFFNTLHSSEGHTHNDKLSIYPVISGKLVFIDRGTFSYTGFPAKRHEDRRSSSHNGPVVNGWEQSRIWKHDLFYNNGDAKCDNHYQYSDNEFKITGWHTGYGRYIKHLKVMREVIWKTEHRIILITDWIEGAKKSTDFQVSWYFLINPEWKGAIKNNLLTLNGGEHTIYLEFMDGISVNLCQGSYCPGYQTETPCQALHISRSVSADERTSFILDY